MQLNSKKVSVQKSASALCDYLADVKNFEELMPENISKFEVIRDNAFVFALKGMPEIALEVKEVDKPNKVVLGAISDKLPFTLTGDIDAISDDTSTVVLNFEGEFNSMMAMMIKGPISKFIETLSANMAKL
ncbi:SRPBCC family protein [Aequorivita marina]|uniref:SRPBCC family protein n=1 Tax=Aequorivita marina TaxID=3073654 RepID=UPI0028751C03|nr:SRPBCC family protein [Aequorivita sp. S2608]MDS1298319.1 SRPBCC family protein [Aequorivita sp. S2608]